MDDAEESKNAAIKTLGSLFRVTEVFLWNDGFVKAFKKPASNDFSEEAFSSGHNPVLSRSFSDLKMDDDYAEDMDQFSEMNALGLPTSFRTNKGIRKEIKGSESRSARKKSSTNSEVVEAQINLEDATMTLAHPSQEMISVSDRTTQGNGGEVCCSRGRSNSEGIEVSRLEITMTESEERPANISSSECANVISRFYDNGVEWGVFWDDFYSRSYYYNFHTQESTWFHPSEKENSAPPCASSEKHHDIGEEVYLNECLDHASKGAFELHEEQHDEESSGHALEEAMLDSDFSSVTFSESKVFVEDSDGQYLVDKATNQSVVTGLQEGRTISLPEAVLTSGLSNDYHCSSKSKKKKKMQRIGTNQKRLTEQIKEQSPDWENEGLSFRTAKYWCQRYSLFSRFDSGVQMDEEGWFSVTPEAIAKHQASRCGSGLVIDAFTGVGGNAIQFAMKATHVLAIDIDNEKLDCAQQNSAIYGLRLNIDFVLGDFFLLSSHLKADIIFLSPPWGGPEYSKVQTYDIQSMLKPRDGRVLFVSAAKIAPKVEKNYLNGKLKGVTAYFSHPDVCGEAQIRSPRDDKELKSVSGSIGQF
ncbi:S-adenosyl-L-methionine-dependent methyltransferases superfamily protein isoform X2 [Wolffia australiana]